MKRISEELSDQVDDLLINVESALNVDEALGGLKSEKITTNGSLPDKKKVAATKVATIRYVLINVRYKWPELFSDVITDCIEDPNTELNWRKLFELSKYILRARNRGGQKHRRNNEQRVLERINLWNSGNIEGLWNKVCSLNQSKRPKDTNSKEIIIHARKLCFQGQYGRAAKVLASDGFVPVNNATLDSFKNCIPLKKKPFEIQIFHRKPIISVRKMFRNS